MSKVPSERMIAIIDAAFRPTIFASMRTAKCHEMTEPDRQAWLRARQFSLLGARQCSKSYMDTVRFVLQEAAADVAEGVAEEVTSE